MYRGRQGLFSRLTQSACDQVRACVRDLSKPDKVDHLYAMNYMGLKGSVELVEADLFDMGSYDAALEGCQCLIHAGAAVGYNRESPQQVYDGCYTSTIDVLNSCIKAKTVKRVVFTSSFAAVGHTAPPGYVFTESDWCGDNTDGYWGADGVEGGAEFSDFKDMIGENRDLAYAMAKAESEVAAYKMADEHGFVSAASSCRLSPRRRICLAETATVNRRRCPSCRATWSGRCWRRIITRVSAGSGASAR